MNAESPIDTSAPSCARCGRRLPGDSPYRLCPYCLLSPDAAAPAATRSANIEFQPPEPDALQHFFPLLEIGPLIGHGGMGAVYRARQRSLGRAVALKILPPEIAATEGFTERFAREAHALARLSHPHVVAVFDHGTAGPYAYLVMELVEGINLRQLMAAGRLPPEEALRIVVQLCDALQYAHRQGVIHRDIKPENILVDDAGRVKITDFGLAKVAAGGDDGARTATRQVMGTLHYMAPEQFERPREVDHRADLYSLGVVFYELLTGELPLGRFDPPSRRASAGRQVDHVVMKSLEKDPSRRYGSAAEVRDDLERAHVGDRWTEAAERIDRHMRHAGLQARSFSERLAGNWLQFSSVLLHVVFYALVIGAVAAVLDTRGPEWFMVALWMGLGLWAAAWLIDYVTTRVPLPDSLTAVGQPVRYLARLPKRIWTWLTDACRVIQGLRVPLIAAAWIALAIGLLLLIGAFSADDDLFAGALAAVLIAWLLARWALPGQVTVTLPTARWLVYPPVLPGTLLISALLLLWPLALWMILTAVDPQWIEHVTGFVSGRVPTWNRYQLLRVHVIGATCAETVWMFLLATGAALSPATVRWIARPLLDNWQGSGRWWVWTFCFVALAIAVSLWSF